MMAIQLAAYNALQMHANCHVDEDHMHMAYNIANHANAAWLTYIYIYI